MRIVSILPVVLCAACLDHEDVTALRDFRTAALTAMVSNDGTDLRVLLVDRANVGGDCTVIEDRVTATVDGAPLEVTSRGAYVDAPVGSGSDCEFPAFHAVLAASSAPTSTIAITDGTTTFTAAIEALRAPRAFTLAGELHPGMDARLVWSVPTDTVAQRGLETRMPGVVWTPEQGMGFALGGAYAAPGARLDGAALVVSIPATAAPGAGKLAFSDLLGPTIARCDGVTICEAPAAIPPALPATIAP